MRKTLALAMLCVLGLAGGADARTITFNWTWPTANQDASALPLSAITGATIYDTTQPAPGLPGTAVTCGITPLPPTTATGTCTTGTIPAGTHSYVIEVSNSAGLGVPTAPLQVVVPQSTPNAATNFTATVN